MPALLRFARYREIAVEVTERLAALRNGRDPLAPWDEEVLLPSAGLTQAIAAELAGGAAGLQLQSLETLARRIVNAAGELPRVADSAERRLAMRTAVRAIDDPMMESRGIASMLERAYRDVRDSGVTLADLAHRVRGARGLRNARRTQILLRAWSEYERLIAQLGAIDPADLLTRATALVASGANVRTQLVAGFYDMTGVQRKLVEALLATNKVAAIWIPTDSPFAQPLVAAFSPHTLPAESPALLHIKQPAVTATQLDTRATELRDVCTRIAALLDAGVDAKDIGIVARSLEPYDARLLHRFAEELGFATTLDDALPLAAHRIGRGVVTLLRLRDRGFPRAEVLELVRDGLHTRTKLDVDAVDAATRRARVAGGTSEELAPFRNRSPLLDAYLALVAELEELTAPHPAPAEPPSPASGRGQTPKASGEGLSILFGRLSSLFRIETDADLAAAECIDEIAALFARASVWKRPLDATSFLDAIEQSTLPSRTARNERTVWAGEILRFRGRTFQHLFVVRMQDDVFPQRRNEDPLLPDSDRRLLGLREIGDGAEEEQLLFRLLFDAATTSLHFSYAGGDGFGKVLRASRFLRSAAAPAAALDDPKRQLTPPHSRRQLQLLAKAGTRSEFDGYLTTIHAQLAKKLESISPTQLEDFGECPQKFLLKHVFGVEDLDHPERELQIHHRDKGTLDHRILERFYRDLGESDIARAAAVLPLLPDDLTSRLDALIDDAFDRHEEDVPPFNRTVRGIERRATKRLLREFLIHDLGDLAANGLAPRHFEYRFGLKHRDAADHPEPFIVDVAGVPLRIEGTIDRIDADTARTRFRIVDYKSGKALRHVDLDRKIDRGVRLQLALYAMAVADFFRAENVSGTIKPLVVADLNPRKFAFELAGKRDALVETLRIFVTSIMKGVFPAFPNEGDFDSCKYCPVNHSCRTKHDAAERYAVQQEKDPRTLLGSAQP